MYTLRSIKKSDSIQNNYCLGKQYTLLNRHVNPADFDIGLAGCFKDSASETKQKALQDVFAIIYDENYNSHPLWVDSDHYIMMPNGQTFARIVD